MNAVIGFLSSVWNLVPGIITAANGVVHVAHETLHQVADLLTLTIK